MKRSGSTNRVRRAPALAALAALVPLGAPLPGQEDPNHRPPPQPPPPAQDPQNQGKPQPRPQLPPQIIPTPLIKKPGGQDPQYVKTGHRFHDHKPTNVSNINQLGNSDPFGFAAGDRDCYLAATVKGAELGIFVYRPVYDGNTVNYERPGTTPRLGNQAFVAPRLLTVVPAGAGGRETLFLAQVVDGKDTLWRWNGDAWSSLVAGTAPFTRIDSIRWQGGQLLVQGGIADDKVILRAVTNVRTGPMAFATVLPPQNATRSAHLDLSGSLLRYVLESDTGSTLHRVFVFRHKFAATAIDSATNIGIDLYFTARQAGQRRLYYWNPAAPTPTRLTIDPQSTMPFAGTLVAATATEMYAVTRANVRPLGFPDGVVIQRIHAMTTYEERVIVLARTDQGEKLFELQSDGLVARGSLQSALTDPRAFGALDGSLNLIDGTYRCWNLTLGQDEQYWALPKHVDTSTGRIGETILFRGMALFAADHRPSISVPPPPPPKGVEIYRWWFHSHD